MELYFMKIETDKKNYCPASKFKWKPKRTHIFNCCEN